MPVNKALAKVGKFRQWVLQTGTRAIEGLNALLLILFSVIMVINYFHLLQLPSYFRFNLTQWWHWIVILFLAISQIAAMTCKSNRSNQVSGLILMLSGCVWFLIAAIFSANSAGVITTGVTTYSVVSLFCTAAGYELLKVNKWLEDCGYGEA